MFNDSIFFVLKNVKFLQFIVYQVKKTISLMPFVL